MPKGTQLEDIREILELYNMEFSEIHNPMVQAQLRPGELYFRATKDYCDCGTVLASLNSLQDFQTVSKSKKVKALKKKNWTDDEISNWINEKLKTKQDEKSKKFNPIERNEKLDRWVNFLHDLLGDKKVSRIAILKHWYSRGLEDETIKIGKTQKISIDEVNHDLLLNLYEDTLYEIFPIYNF